MSPTEDGVVPTESAGVRPTHEEPPELPKAPSIDRRIHFHPPMIAGLVMVGLLPVLALFGLFGIGRLEASGATESVSVSVDYPRVQRLKVRQPLRLVVTNETDSVLPSVELLLSRSYVQSFADVAFTPGPDEVGGTHYRFEMTEIEPGGSRVVSGEMQAQEYWHQPGSLDWRVLDDEGGEVESGQLTFATMVWP